MIYYILYACQLRGVYLHVRSRAQWRHVEPAPPPRVCYSRVLVFAWLLYFVWAVLRALNLPVLHFQTSVSVFRLEVLRCLRPVPTILQTAADPSSDKASLCVSVCAGWGHRVFVGHRHVLKYACVFFLLWPIWGKPFVTDRFALHCLLLSEDTVCHGVGS